MAADLTPQPLSHKERGSRVYGVPVYILPMGQSLCGMAFAVSLSLPAGVPAPVGHDGVRTDGPEEQAMGLRSRRQSAAGWSDSAGVRYATVRKPG